ERLGVADGEAVSARDHDSLLSPGPVLWAARSRRASRHWTVLMARRTRGHVVRTRERTRAGNPQGWHRRRERPYAPATGHVPGSPRRRAGSVSAPTRRH